jgi:acetylornithine deacetylase
VQRRAEKYVAELLLPRMKARHPDANIELKRRSFLPALNPDENVEAAKLALEWTGGNRTYAVPYGTEAGIFRGHGVSTVICGPGDIAQAHQPNEFVARSQMDACDAFVGKVIKWAETR